MIDTSNLTILSPDDLTSAIVALRVERNRRHAIAQAPARANASNRALLSALGYRPGDPWILPPDSLHVYPMGWPVTLNGVTWSSLIPNNATMPGDPDDPQSYRWWQDVSTPPDTGNHWDGNAHAYFAGDPTNGIPADVVTYKGNAYTCIQSHTSQPGWDPVTVPALWKLVTSNGLPAVARPNSK